jgi:hypothetical protein
MAARHLELGHRWGCHPVWDQEQGCDLDPALLPLPASIVDRLTAWAARWDLTFDVAHPERPKVERFVLEELGRDGARLWRALLGLLPPQEFSIAYVHEDVIYRTVDELPLEWRIG